ncbi:hypothetical protein ABPG74_013326 [Tetrahymena malaccensis]
MMDRIDESDKADKKKKKKHIIEYNQFIEEFEFVHLSGLKGLERARQIQQKSTNKMFDYIEMDLRGVETIDKYENYCESLFEINQKEILQMKFYSRVFVEESLGDPYCRYFLIFEYCESSVETEIQHQKKRNKQLKKSTLRKIFESVAIALNHFHTKQIVHGDLRSCKIFKNEQGQYKLMPPKIKNRKNTEKYYHSPEYHLSKHFRAAYEKQQNNPIKGEIYTFGMIMLELGTFSDDLFNAYGKFQMNEDVIQNALQNFSMLYGYHLTAVVKKMLNLDAQLRPTANDIIELLQSQELHEMEKEINNPYTKLQHSFQSESEEDSNAATTSHANYNQLHPQSHEEKFKREDGNKKSTFFLLQPQSSQNIQLPAIKINIKAPSNVESQDSQQDVLNTSTFIAKNNVLQTHQSSDKTPVTNRSQRSRQGTQVYVKSSLSRQQSNSSIQGDSKNFQTFGRVAKAVIKLKDSVRNEEEEEDNDDLAREKKIYETLPQEYQDEIDSKVNENLKNIERDYTVDYLPNGHRYQGEKLQGIPHGWGIFWWANGEIYEGEFLNGKYHGIGIYYWPTGVKHYGEFNFGEIKGLGVRFYQEGDIYFGEWHRGKNHGKGTFYWQKSLAKFKGNFLKDKIYGKGTLILPIFEDRDQEPGEYKGSQKSSIFQDKDANKDKVKETRIYEGLWKDEEGKGIYVEEIEFSAQKEGDDLPIQIEEQEQIVNKQRWKI